MWTPLLHCINAGLQLIALYQHWTWTTSMLVCIHSNALATLYQHWTTMHCILYLYVYKLRFPLNWYVCALFHALHCTVMHFNVTSTVTLYQMQSTSLHCHPHLPWLDRENFLPASKKVKCCFMLPTANLSPPSQFDSPTQFLQTFSHFIKHYTLWPLTYVESFYQEHFVTNLKNWLTHLLIGPVRKEETASK